MTLTERLKQIPAVAKRIRESLSLVQPDGDGVYHTIEQAAKAEMKLGRIREARVMEMAKLLLDVYEGKRPKWHLQEAMTTSDFPLLFGDVLYRQMLGHYTAWPVNYTTWMRVTEVNDFRAINMYMIDGGGGIPLEAVKERAPYPEISFSESRTQLSVAKYGRRYGVSFEMMVNDDLQAFQDRPRLMAEDSRMSEQYLATSKMWDAAGPHASVYTVGNANIVASNPVLSLAALQTAMTMLSKKKDSSGRPIFHEFVYLVVGPGLEITAMNILNAIQLELTEAGGTSGQKLIAINWMKGRVKLIVDPFIPLITTTGTVADTAWVLVGSPGAARPAFHFGFLRGRRVPQLSMKAPNNITISGPTLGPADGDFDTDSIDYRVRHIFGAAFGDATLTVASKGTGS